MTGFVIEANAAGVILSIEHVCKVSGEIVFVIQAIQGKLVCIIASPLKWKLLEQVASGHSVIDLSSRPWGFVKKKNLEQFYKQHN